MNLYCERLKSKVNACTTVITLQGIGSSVSLQIEIRMLYLAFSLLCFWTHLLGMFNLDQATVEVQKVLQKYYKKVLQKGTTKYYKSTLKVLQKYSTK